MDDKAPIDPIAALRARFRTRLREEAAWVHEAAQSGACNDELRARLHRLKGAASMFEYAQVAAAAQAAEDAVAQGNRSALAEAWRALLTALESAEKS